MPAEQVRHAERGEYSADNAIGADHTNVRAGGQRVLDGIDDRVSGTRVEERHRRDIDIGARSGAQCSVENSGEFGPRLHLEFAGKPYHGPAGRRGSGSRLTKSGAKGQSPSDLAL